MKRVRVPKQAIRAVRRSGLSDVDKRKLYRLLNQLAQVLAADIMVSLAKVGVKAMAGDAEAQWLAEVAS